METLNNTIYHPLLVAPSSIHYSAIVYYSLKKHIWRDDCTDFLCRQINKDNPLLSFVAKETPEEKMQAIEFTELGTRVSRFYQPHYYPAWLSNRKEPHKVLRRMNKRMAGPSGSLVLPYNDGDPVPRGWFVGVEMVDDLSGDVIIDNLRSSPYSLNWLGEFAR